MDEDFITDSFNLFGLKALIPRYDEALEMILSPDTPESEDLKNQNFLDLYQLSMDLYGLIHAKDTECKIHNKQCNANRRPK